MIARWDVMARYWAAIRLGSVNSRPVAAGRRNELIGSVSLSSGEPPNPWAARSCVRFERGVLAIPARKRSPCETRELA
ncbi:hypothetical protein GCM10010282_61280 [Streptomyces roseolus]|nr:hypothetical protein GCM10010282_61280 [Streptomyces roseolus]